VPNQLGVDYNAHWSTILSSALFERASMHPRCHQAIAQLA